MPSNAHPQRPQILDLAREGMRPKDIADRLGLPRNKVESVVYHARRIGCIPARGQEDRDLKYLIRKTGIGYGHTKDLHDALTLEQQGWLVDECAALGVSSIMEYMLELVRDAHAEATMKKEQNDG